MRKRSSLILITALFCFGAAGHAQTVNPILPHPDPFITHDPVTSDGRYVLTATTGKNITLWSGPSPATAVSDPRVVFSAIDGMTQIWSPTIWQIGGRWWIYFTAMMPGERHSIFVLESDSPDVLGSYSYKGKLETGAPTIDPSLLEVSGVRYLMYVAVDHGENAILIRKLKSPMQFDGPGGMISEPKYPWESGYGSSNHYPVNEGPTALYHDGKTFIVYSASHTASPRYCLGLLTLTGSEVTSASSWKKTPHPVFEWSPEHGIFGPGRGTFAQAKDGKDWLLYAAKSTNDTTAANRSTRSQPFSWNAMGEPDFGIPEKDGPILP